MLSRRAATVFGLADALTALVVAVGVFGGLPSRWWPVDGAAAMLVAAHGLAAFGLLGGTSWGRAFARVTAAVSLAVGVALATTLALTASWLRGVYGPIGAGGAVLFALVAALVLPYLVVLPAVQVVWLSDGGPRPAARRA
jgi:hypothetical protein